MTHEDLRSIEEQFAERLYNLAGKGSIDIRPWDSIGHEARALFLEHAREAKRWAEWARRRCGITQTPQPSPGPDIHITVTDLADLTLPPRGWAP